MLHERIQNSAMAHPGFNIFSNEDVHGYHLKKRHLRWRISSLFIDVAHEEIGPVFLKKHLT
jgi:hypothetical protein